MATDLELAYAVLSGKQARYTELWNYFNGEAPLVYTNARLEEVFQNLNARFTENWCSVVIGSVADRIELLGLNAKGQEEAFATLWEQCQLGLVSDDVHEAALVCGEAFAIAWPNARNETRVYYNDPRLCHVFYEDDDPYMVRFAAKWYDETSGEGKRRLTLYYPDRLEYYVSSGKAANVSNASAFGPAETPVAANPYGEVPVFHFRPRRDGLSELQNVVPLQNGINKLLADMIVAAEYGAFKQRWIISNADVKALKNAPNEIWLLPAGDGMGQQTQIGEFAPTDLMIYLNAIERLAVHVGVITKTPKHYLLQQGGDPSGESLMAMEAPLIHKCQRYIERFTPTWKALGAFVARLLGMAVDASAIEPVFDDPETVQPRTEAEIRRIDVNAGIPLVTVLRREGWTEDEIAQMIADRDEAASKQQANLASALVSAQRQMDQGGEEEAPQQPPPRQAEE
jgi:hypothetical protein